MFFPSLILMGLRTAWRIAPESAIGVNTKFQGLSVHEQGRSLVRNSPTLRDWPVELRGR
jgi:hypothetical protein